MYRMVYTHIFLPHKSSHFTVGAVQYAVKLRRGSRVQHTTTLAQAPHGKSSYSDCGRWPGVLWRYALLYGNGTTKASFYTFHLYSSHFHDTHDAVLLCTFSINPFVGGGGGRYLLCTCRAFKARSNCVPLCLQLCHTER